MKAQDMIKPGETAVAIFTRGGRFVYKPDGIGSTGNWVISKSKKVSKVILYKQGAKGKDHEIYVAKPVAVIDSDEEGRREVKMVDIQFIGSTSSNWNEFTETKRGAANPIKYVKRK